MDTSPTALFDSYEQDFRRCIDTIRGKLTSNAHGELPNVSLQRIEMDIDDADEMVAQMEIEMQGIPQSVRGQYRDRLSSAKADIKSCIDIVRSQLARANLLASPTPRTGDYPSDDPYGSGDRTRLLAGTSLLEDGTKRLHDSHRIALETEGHGADILSNLRRQREQIENSRHSITRADAAVDRASATLKNMIHRMYQQRALTVAIIVVLTLIIAIIIWEKFS